LYGSHGFIIAFAGALYICTYPESHQSSPHHSILARQDLSYFRLSSGLPLSGNLTSNTRAFPFSQFVLHLPPMSHSLILLLKSLHIMSTSY
jgi:hypothetical protein